jgi:hypothetical protein
MSLELLPCGDWIALSVPLTVDGYGHHHWFTADSGRDGMCTDMFTSAVAGSRPRAGIPMGLGRRGH